MIFGASFSPVSLRLPNNRRNGRGTEFRQITIKDGRSLREYGRVAVSKKVILSRKRRITFFRLAECEVELAFNAGESVHGVCSRQREAPQMDDAVRAEIE